MSPSHGAHDPNHARATERSSPQPPEAPAVSRRLALTRKQWLGLPILAAIPVLALFGVFGESRSEARAVSPSIEMVVRYPNRFRYRQVQSLSVTVRNVSRRSIDTLEISLDTAYLTRFSSVRVEPAPRSAFVVSLTDVRPGQSHLVSAELWGEQYGSHYGRIVAVAGADSVAVEVHTFVFP